MALIFLDLNLSTPGHGLSNFLGGDHSSHWEAIAHALGHGDNVRDHPMALKAPEVFPSPAKSCLDLIRDAHSSQLSGPGKGLLEVALRVLDSASYTLDRLSKEPS